VKNKKPHALNPGATVGVVCVAAPEGKQFRERLELGVTKLERLGFSVELAPHVTEQNGFMSASPDIVADELMRLFEDPACDAILCAGGGNTSSLLLPHLDFEIIAANPKVFVGASNPTTLLNVISQHSELITFHGPSVIWDFGDPNQPDATVDSFLDRVREGSQIIAPMTAWLREGEAEGTLLGGNLTALANLIGTRFEPAWDGAVLAWEDVGEDAAHLVAMLAQLDQAGVLSEIGGMIVGSLENCGPTDGVEPLDAIERICSQYAFPIAIDVPFGHTSLKYTLPIGATVRMSNLHGRLEATEPSVITPRASGRPVV
jgi:muramoyltetrapeptide carboxypeptidase